MRIDTDDFGRLAPRTLALLVAIGVLSIGAGQGPVNNTARLLTGTIDIHVHSDPDNVPRSVDGLEAARLARANGMRGIVLKNHYDPTAGLAYLARRRHWARGVGGIA